MMRRNDRMKVSFTSPRLRERDEYPQRIGLIILQEPTCSGEMRAGSLSLTPHGCFKGKDGLNYSNTHILFMYDLQVDHNTILSNGYIEFNRGIPIEDYTLKKMLEMGR